MMDQLMDHYCKSNEIVYTSKFLIKINEMWEEVRGKRYWMLDAGC
jgi:hypothetical protein